VFKAQSYSALQKIDKFIEFMKESRALWRIITTPSKTDRSPSEKTEIDELVTEIFLSPH
jgi:hypothetical protein